MTETADAPANGSDFTSSGPTAPGEVMVTWAHDANDPAGQESWTQQVVSFTTALRTVGGIDADLDLFHLFEAGIDWTRWGPSRVRTASRILIVINAAWRQRFEGEGPPTRGAGAAAEANVLLGQFAENRQTFEARTVLVVLPGASEADVPTQLRGLQRVHVATFDAAGLDGLLRLLTDQPLYPKPAVGSVPFLPPATRRDLRRVADHPEQLRVTPNGVQAAGSTGTITAQPAADVTATSTMHADGDVSPATTDGSTSPPVRAAATVTPLEETALQAWSSIADARVTAAAGVREAPAANSGAASTPDPPQSPPRHVVAYDTADFGVALLLRRVLDVVEGPTRDRPTLGSASATLAEQVGHLLAVQHQRIAAALDRPERCWLLLAAQPVPLSSDGPAPVPPGAKQRAERLLREMVQNRWLPVTLSGFDNAIRASRLTVFSGHPTPFRPAAPTSSHWRLELGDRGESVVAACVGQVAPPDGSAPERLLQPDQHGTRAGALVRRDTLEVWLLVQLELLAEHFQRAVDDARTDDHQAAPLALGLQASLLLPPVRPAPGSFLGQTSELTDGVQVVQEHRDQDGHRIADYPCAGSRALPVHAVALNTEVLLVSRGLLEQPGDLVGWAHQLAVQLLEHFGVEGTQVLTDSGELDELAAGEADQQAVWQHARALGLPHDEVSPAVRRQRHEEFMAQARAALRR